jgi:hypothetical protein
VFGFSASPYHFRLLWGAVEIHSVSLFQSFVMDFCAGLIEVVCVHALVPLGVALRVIRESLCESTDFGENDPTGSPLTFRSALSGPYRLQYW